MKLTTQNHDPRVSLRPVKLDRNIPVDADSPPLLDRSEFTVNDTPVLNGHVKTAKPVVIGSAALGGLAGIGAGSALWGVAGAVLAPVAFAVGGVYGFVRGFKVDAWEPKAGDSPLAQKSKKLARVSARVATGLAYGAAAAFVAPLALMAVGGRQGIKAGMHLGCR